MKPRVDLALVCFVAAQAIAPLFAAESNTSAPAESAPPPPVKAVFVDPDDPVAADYRALGEKAIDRLAYSLVTEVSSAVARGGLAAGMRVAHLKTVPSSGAVIPDMPRIVAWKRTSLRLRDVSNSPDPAERLVLKLIRSDIEEGNSPPKLLVQRVDHPDGAKEWRVYRPVGVARQCLACHGDADSMAVELRDLVQTRYPADEAMGYSAGEWRGIMRVTVADAPPPASPTPQSPVKAPPPKKK
jgi:hypothetical protein